MSAEIKTSNTLGIVAENHTGYVEAMFACLEQGNIAVPLRSSEDRDRTQVARVTEVITPRPGESWMKRELPVIRTDNIALIAFTSGTEGQPKGVILTHNNLADVVDRLNTTMRVDDSIREYIGVPVYHSFGFGRCRAVAAARGQFFIPENGFNPAEIGTMLRSGEINAISAVPSLWRVLLTNKDLIGNHGRQVHWIEIGSQYMSRQEKEAIKSLFPEARIIQHYGLTEASRTTLLEIHAVEGDALESVGQATGDVAVKLTDTGRIAIRGPHLAQGYLMDGQEVKLPAEDSWFLTKDLGKLEDGYLYYQGRADDVINCGGIKVQPETLETEIYASIGYSNGLAICRKPDLLRGDGFLVAVTKEIAVDRPQLREVILQSTQTLGVNAANAITIVEVDQIPKTATGKIQRRQLETWYTLEHANVDKSTEVQKTSAAAHSPIQAVLCRSLNITQVNPGDTFISLGGDSLSYIQLSMELERHLGYLPKNWEQTSLEELERLIPQKKGSTTVEIDILLRALAISGVVLNHSGFHVVKGAALLLFLIAGLNFSRFQGRALMEGKLSSILLSLRHILIPYLILAFSYQLFKKNFDPLILFLLGNFQTPVLQQSNSIFFVWFVANLVQTVILFSIPFNLQTIRDFACKSPWRFGLFALGIGVITRLLGPFLWDTSYLYDQVPHMLFWLFMLGWCIYFAQSQTEKTVVAVILSISIPSFIGLDNFSGWWLLIGGMLLLWLPYIALPRLIKAPVQVISVASYHIYLTFMIFIHFATNVAGIRFPPATFLVALLGGLITWSGIQSFQQWVSNRWRYKVRQAESM